MSAFEKIDLPQKHIVNGEEFPYALRFTKDASTVEEATRELESAAASGLFKKLVEKHGVVVLRDLPGQGDPQILSQYIEIIGSKGGDESFEQNGSTAQRHDITEILSTANEGPSDRMLFQHNEFSRFIKYPSKLFFVCSNFDATGGETPLVHGAELYNELYKKSPEFVKTLSKQGLYLKQSWPLVTPNNTGWTDRFCFGRNIKEGDSLEVKRQKAEAIASEWVSKDFEWGSEGEFVIHEFTTAVKKYVKEDGSSFPVLFNSIPAFYGDVKNGFAGSEKTFDIKYGNKEEIPREYLDQVLDGSIDLAYNHTWKTGDIAIVDNYQVSHGRLPWEGARKVLVSMWDKSGKGKFEDYVLE